CLSSRHCMLLLFSLLAGSPLFPYTTLFRSDRRVRTAVLARARRIVSGVRRGVRFYHVNTVEVHCARFVRRAKRGFVVQSWSESRSEEHTSELQSRFDLVCRLLLEKKKKNKR